ncbi:MAG: DUF58 domain-containing protein [Microbacterium sp.]
MFLTGRAAIAIALGAVPVIALNAAGVNAWGVFVVWLLLCGALITLDVLLAVRPQVLQIERELPVRVRLGQQVTAKLRLINLSERRVRARVRDGWQPTAGNEPSRLRVDVPAGESRAYRFALHPRRRGELRTAFVAVRIAGPLGLAGRQRTLEAPDAIRVLPPFTSRRHLASRVIRLRELDGNTSLQVRGQGTEFDSLREYVRGDDVRSIDWRATARSTNVMLRTWRPERDRHVVIVIDTGRTAAARVGDSTRLEASFESALLLAALAHRAGDHVHLVAFDRVVRARVSGVDGPALVPALVDALAPVEAQLIDTDWDAALNQARRLWPHPSLLVLLTAQESLDASRGFLGVLPSVTGHGTVVIVGTATDGALADAATSRGSTFDAYRAASAEASLAAASRVARAIERAGADAVTDTPEDLPPRIADRYLALKKAGLL